MSPNTPLLSTEVQQNAWVCGEQQQLRWNTLLGLLGADCSGRAAVLCWPWQHEQLLASVNSHMAVMSALQVTMDEDS